MAVTVIDRYGSRIDKTKVKNFVKFLMKRFGVNPKMELNVLLSGDEEMSIINGRYTGRNGTTDVLAFFGYDKPVLGDIVVSLDMARAECNSVGLGFFEYVLFLIAHGFLHLVGYDHETEDELRKMMDLQRKLLEEWKHETEGVD